MAHLKASIGSDPYAVSLTAGRHVVTADEPARLGGGDVGPSPYELLLASLAACTLITLRMYADRKQWVLRNIRADLTYDKPGDRGRVRRTITVDGDLDAAQRTRLGEIAEKTPVTLTLKAGVDIETTLT